MPPPLLDFLNNLGDDIPPLGGDFLGEDYGLFERASAIHSFMSPQKNVAI